LPTGINIANGGWELLHWVVEGGTSQTWHPIRTASRLAAPDTPPTRRRTRPVRPVCSATPPPERSATFYTVGQPENVQ
jgi:hypothetical protein